MFYGVIGTIRSVPFIMQWIAVVGGARADRQSRRDTEVVRVSLANCERGNIMSSLAQPRRLLHCLNIQTEP